MLFKTRLAFAFVALFLMLTGCAVSTKDTGIITGPITTQHGQADASFDVKEMQLPQTVAFLPFVNKTNQEDAFEVVRRILFNHFSSKNYHTVHLKDVDTRLKAANLFDTDKFASLPPAELCKLLGVDGLMYGEITHYDRYFVGVYAQIAVGVKMRFVDKNGKEIWTAQKVTRTHAGGLSTTPVGLIMSALSAGLHLREINLYRAGDDLARELIASIPEPKYLDTKRPPMITALVHDAVGKYLKYGDTLQIAMEGDAGKKAYARVEGLGLVDLVEVQPGVYSGKVTISKTQNVTDEMLIGVLQDSSGLKREWVCPLGLINVDNIPPQPVKDLQATSKDSAILLTWAKATDKDVKGYKISASDTVHGEYKEIGFVTDTSFEEKGLKNFIARNYKVVAVDRAQNLSPDVVVSAKPAPDARFAVAEALKDLNILTITGIKVLTSQNSPYKLTNKVQVQDTAVLFVEPGVVFNVGTEGNLQVKGELHIFGNPEQRVIASSLDKAVFKTFLTLSSEKPVTIKGLEVRGGGIQVAITDGSPQITDSLFLGSAYSAFDISGVSKPVITGCQIKGSGSSGIIITDKAQPKLTGNHFVENVPFHIQSSSSYVISALGNTWMPSASELTIMGNVQYK